MFVFESGICINVGVVVPSELYSVVRFHGSFLSFALVDLKRIKKANPNPSIMKNKTTKNGKTSAATPIIIAKYFPYDLNTLKNNKSLKFTNIIENAVIGRDAFLLISQYIDVIIGKKYAPTSINKKVDYYFLINQLYSILHYLLNYQINFLDL